MLCNIKPVPFHESDKHIFAKIPGPDPRSPPLDPPMVYQHFLLFSHFQKASSSRLFPLLDDLILRQESEDQISVRLLYS